MLQSLCLCNYIVAISTLRIRASSRLCLQRTHVDYASCSLPAFAQTTRVLLRQFQSFHSLHTQPSCTLTTQWGLLTSPHCVRAKVFCKCPLRLLLLPSQSVSTVTVQKASHVCLVAGGASGTRGLSITALSNRPPPEQEKTNIVTGTSRCFSEVRARQRRIFPSSS